MKSLRKPRLGLAPTGAASSAEVPQIKVRAAISFWEENRSVQNAPSMLQLHDSHAPAKIEGCSNEGSMRNSDILSLQLELDILKIILVEEVKARAAEAEDRAASLCLELKAANFRIEVLESDLSDLIKESNELKKNNFQSPGLHEKMDTETPRLNGELDIHHGNEYVPNEDQASHCSSEHVKDEDCRQAEFATSEVIISLTEELSSVKVQLNASKKNELLAKQNLNEIHRMEFLLDESIETLVQKDIHEQNFVSLLMGMEERICQLESQLAQSIRCYEVRLKEQEIKMQELEDVASASFASWHKEREIAEQRKAYVEENNKKVKLLERSMEDLEVTVCSFQKEVDIMKEEAEHQRRQREDIEVELQNVRQQLRAVPSSAKEGSFLEDGIVDLADSTRHQSDMNREQPSAQESRIFHREISIEPAPQVEHPKEPFSDEHVQELEQISSSKQPELFGSGADSDQFLSAFDSEQVRPPAMEPVIEVLKENELPPVALVRLNDPVNYMRAPSDELKRLRSRNPYEGPRTATDKKFWSIEQQDLYTFIYRRAKPFEMNWIKWKHIADVREQCAHLGLEEIMSYRCDWDSELIRQFYSTVHISADKSSMTWMADGRRITANKRAWEQMFGIPGGVHTEIHSQFLLDDDDKRILYTAADCTLGQISGLTPLASVADKIIRRTIYPKSGNTVHTHFWNLLYNIVERKPFDILALIFGEIDLLISDRSRTKDRLFYAPYIMGMIKKAFHYEGPIDSTHGSYEPRDPYKLKQKKKGSRRSELEVEAHVEAGDHWQLEAAGRQPKGEAGQGQAEAIARTDPLQVVEGGLRPIRDSLASMVSRVGRVEIGPALPVQHTNSSSSSQIPAPRSPSSVSPTTPAAASEQASRMHADDTGAQPGLVKPSPFTQPALVRPSPSSRFPWYQRYK